TGWPLTSTRGSGASGCAGPAWEQVTMAPRCSTGPGIGSSYTTVSAPALMSTAGPSRLITAPLPLEMTMPTSEMEMSAPVLVISWIPPVGPGTSLMTIPLSSVVCSVIPGTPGGTVWDSAGTSAAEPQ